MYAALKHLHVACVILSYTGFILRFVLVSFDSPAAKTRFARTAPHVIDTILLGAAIGMLAVAGMSPLEQPWLLAKIAGLVVYIVAGAFALGRARTLGGRWSAFGIATLAIAFVASAALTKNPWGFLAP